MVDNTVVSLVRPGDVHCKPAAAYDDPFGGDDEDDEDGEDGAARPLRPEDPVDFEDRNM